MRDNWRAGYVSNQGTNLVTDGIYRIGRNPAFVGFDLLYIGCAAVFPNIANIAVALMAVVLFHCQILGEEKHCAGAFSEKYADYKSKTMRYLGARQFIKGGSERLKWRDANDETP
jgi:protein-S-isoprenylcysteine O-methyltransferase Ste14